MTACAQLLTDRDGTRARCTRPRYTEHSHHDHTAAEAINAGLATIAPHCVTRAHHTRDQHKQWCRPMPHPADCPTCHAGATIADPALYRALRRRIRRQLARQMSAT